ncbi:MAG: glucokinase, partial [Verrucomicrobiales bacterium]|nr:glucokinase [Verrucomicrobiales bacterium]
NYTDAPIRVDNDANTAALGEASLGAGRGFNPVYYVTLGSGVGGGLVIDGTIYHGALPGEAEIGHLRLSKDGTIVESRCSGWAVDARIRSQKLENPDSLLTKTIGIEVRGEARFLASAVAANDPFAQKILSEIADDLAFALSHVTHLMHPESIVLGGGLSLVGEALRASVEAALPQYVMHAFQPVPKIVLAGLGEDSVPVGALLLAKTA